MLEVCPDTSAKMTTPLADSGDVTSTSSMGNAAMEASRHLMRPLHHKSLSRSSCKESHVPSSHEQAVGRPGLGAFHNHNTGI